MPPRALHALDREGEEPVGGGAAPFLVARRKMHADVAVGERAEDRVGQRMQRDVGIGMAGKLAVVRNLHAAEPDMVAAGVEGVDVIADAGADVGERRLRVALGAGEILRRGHLHVAALALEYRDLAGPPIRPARRRRENPRGLRRRRAGARRAGQGRRTPAASARCAARERSSVAATRLVVVDQLHRVGDGQARNRRAAFRRRRDRAARPAPAEVNGRAASCTSTMSGAVCRERLQPGPHRALTRCRTRHRAAPDEPRGGGGKAGGVVRMDHRQHQIDLRMAARIRAGSPAPSGEPPITLYCLGKSSPARVPRPAATTTAATRIAMSRPGFLRRTKALAPAFSIANGFSQPVMLGILLHRSTCGCGTKWLNSMQMTGRLNSVH